MRVTRREFLGCAAAVPLGWRLGRAARALAAPLHPVVVDLGEHCSLSESLAGFAKVLGSPTAWTDGAALERCDTVILPAAVHIPPTVRDATATCLGGGGLVLLESGAAFASERAFRTHRDVLRDEWHVAVECPASLWLDARAQTAPYIDFVWPFPTKIRDFSVVVPLQSGAGKTVAHLNGVPVAVRRSIGRGTLIVLGTPVGPALWAGDAEAQRWLATVLNAKTVRE